MKKFLVSGLAAAAIAAVGAAPASASAAAAPPPCTLNNVPNAVTCVFDTSAWAAAEALKVPAAAIAAAQKAVNDGLRTVNGAVITVGEAVDDLEQVGVEEICFVALDLDPEDCPTL